MMDPVVSSKFGKRPLLEMPAMHVDSSTRVEVSSLQPRLQPHLDTSPALIYRPDGLNPQRAQAIPPGVGTVSPGVAMAMPAPALTAPSAALPQANGIPGVYALPPGNLPLQPYPYPTQGNGLAMQPQPRYFVDGSGNIINPAPAPAMYPQYPAAHSPYPGYYQPGVGPPPAVMPQVPPQVQYVPVPAPQTPAVADNFQMEGVLEYGRLTTVHFRDKTSNFRGLPDFLRKELQKAYGHFPATEVRIVCQGGEFHIHASPRNEGEDYAEGASDTRMIGWGEVRGEPR